MANEFTKGIIFAVLLIFIVAGFYVISQPSSPTGEVTETLQPSCETVTYTVQEPYMDRECVYENSAYTCEYVTKFRTVTKTKEVCS